MKLWRLSRQRSGLYIARDLHGNVLALAPRDLESVVLGGDVAVFPRATGAPTIAWQGPDGCWYSDALWASSLHHLLQVVLHVER